MGPHFDRVGLLARGYDTASVDAFFDRAQRSLDLRDGTITREDAQQVHFGTRLRGYDCGRVDQELQNLVARLPSRTTAAPPAERTEASRAAASPIAEAGSAEGAKAEPSPVEDSVSADREQAACGVGSVQFSTVRFMMGYEMSEVDDLLDVAAAALRGEGTVDIEVVARVRLATTRFQEGYDMAEVDDYLDEKLVPLLRRHLD